MIPSKDVLAALHDMPVAERRARTPEEEGTEKLSFADPGDMASFLFWLMKAEQEGLGATGATIEFELKKNTWSAYPRCMDLCVGIGELGQEGRTWFDAATIVRTSEHGFDVTVEVGGLALVCEIDKRGRAAAIAGGWTA